MQSHFGLIIGAVVSLPSLLYVAYWTRWACSDGQRKAVAVSEQQQVRQTAAALQIAIDRARRGGR